MKTRIVTALLLAACMLMPFAVNAAGVFAENAQTKKTDVIILGDANLDGKVNTGDATMVLKYCSDYVTLSDEQMLHADANNDAKVNSGDATYILRIVAGYEQIIYIGDEYQSYTITFIAGMEAQGVQLPESMTVEEETLIFIEQGATCPGYKFIGWQTDYDGRIYKIGDGFVMPSRDVVFIATWEGVATPSPSVAPTPSSNPTTNPTSNPTTNPTSNPTNAPTASPTANPTPTATPAPTPDDTEYAQVIFLPGDNSENGGGVQAGSMPETKMFPVGRASVIPKKEIPHSVTLQEGESNAYAFVCWVDENGITYYPGDKMMVNSTDTITLTAKWEAGFQVITTPADIEAYVFENLANKVILGSDLVHYYYNSAYFYPIGFDNEHSGYNQILYEGPFTGKFDGAGYTLYNLTCEYGKSDICSALIYDNRGVVSNVTCKINQIYAASTQVASVACTNNGTIRNVDVTWYRRTGYHYVPELGDIASVDIQRGAYVAGIAAVNNGLISGCSVDDLKIKVCHGRGGGIVAYNGVNGIISGCESNDIKMTFIYDPQGYQYTGNECHAIAPINYGKILDTTSTGYSYTTANDYYATSVDPVILPKKVDFYISETVEE